MSPTRSRPVFLRLGLLSVLAGVLLAALRPVLAQVQPRPAPFARAPLVRSLRGEEALQSLGHRLREVAEFHRMPESRLRSLLQRDRSVWLDRQGRLFYVCESQPPPQPGPVGESTNTPPLNPLYQLTQTFKLHSRPGASRVIYLDFDGHDASTTIWGGGSGRAPIARAFDIDGSPYSMGNTERQRIQYIWARVAEDFLQFDIDVTTEDPGVAALKNSGTGRYGVRVVIGGDSADWFGSSAGGVAYLFSFDDAEDLPCWVFPKSLGDSEKNIAEACSHEAGHALGLFHDGKTSGGVEYYTGHGNWAPIMGVGYDRPIVHWSQGEYYQANNSEDDLDVMLNFGALDRPDDFGDTPAAARPLVGVKPFLWGIIGSRIDLDYFSFEAGAGRTTITATPAPRGPNLRLELSLYDSNGSFLTATNVADNSTAGVLPVTLSAILPTGNYFVAVDGIGSGNPASDGYSDYASLGQYTLTVTLPGDGTWTPTDGGNYAWADAVNWSAGILPLGQSATARVNNDLTGDQTLTLDGPITLGGLWLGDADASHGFTFQAAGAGGLRFGATNGAAWINKVTGGNDAITTPLQLLTNLNITNTTGADLILAGPLAGPHTLMKFGTGRLVLAGTNNISAGLVSAEGVVQLGATAVVQSVATITVQAGAVLDVSAQPGGWPLAAGQVLGGSGAITGAVLTAGNSRLVPGTAGGVGTLSFADQLALNDGTALDFNLTATTNAGDGSNDLIAVAGDLILTGTLTVNFDFAGAVPDTNGAYTLLTYGGTLTGGATNFAAAAAGTRFAYSFDDSVPGEIRVQVAGAPRALVWQGGLMANLWDIGGAENWLDEGLGPNEFYQGDAVRFDSSGVTIPSVKLSGALAPASVTVSNTVGYTFSGSGRISGRAALTKQGSGSLALDTSNNFSGLTLIQDGTVLLGHAAALGLTDVGTTISNAGQLDLNGAVLGGERLTLAGHGPAGTGALVNNGSDQSNAVRHVTLAGDTTLGGAARWDLRAIPAANLTASLTGNGYALTKTGGNELWFANLGGLLLGSITIHQGTLGFEGANTMVNSSAPVTVNAGATLAFRNAYDSDFSKVLALNSCTLQNDSGHNQLSGAATLSGVVTASVGEAAMLDLRGSLGGSGGFDKTGEGIFRLAGANTFAGALTVAAGTVMAGSATALGNAVGATTISAGARLDVAAFNLGAEPVFVAGAGINQRGAIINSLPTSQQNALRFVTLTGDTIVAGNGRWDVRANPTGALLGAFDLTKVGVNEIWLANLDATQLKTISVNEGTLGFLGTTTLGNAADLLAVNPGGTLGLATTGDNLLDKVLALSSGRIVNTSGSNTFVGSASLANSNQLDIASGTTLVLGGPMNGAGHFGKTSSGTLILGGTTTSGGLSYVNAGTLQIGAGGSGGSFISPLHNNAALVFNRTAGLTHAAAISGFGTVNKQNTNTLTLAGANSYSGVTTVSAGTLRVGNGSALGLTGGGTTVAAGATLDLNGFDLGAEVVTAAGSGVAGGGSVINSGATQVKALRFLTLAGPTTLGGSARWDLRAVSGAGDLSTGGQPYSLTKTGVNTIALNDVTVDPALGNVAVQQGVLSIEQGTTGLGDPAASVTVFPGAVLQLYSLTNALAKAITLEDGATLLHAGPVSGGVGSSVSGPVTLTAGNTFVENSSDAYAMVLAGGVNGAANFLKTGPGLVQLDGTNDHTGNTIISTGTLRLGPTATLALSPGIVIAGGAAFEVAALAGGFALGAAQILSGNGTVVGDVIAGGIVSPGSSVGRLTITGNATLAGIARMELTKSGAFLTNDVLSVGGTLICGALLAVTHTGDPLAVGDSFRLFSAGATTGAFSLLALPALNPGLTWNVATVNTDGWLRVVSNTPPVIASVGLSGNDLIFTGAGGAPGAFYQVLTATNVALLLPQWTAVATNMFDAGGNFSFTNALAPAAAHQFFQLRVP